MEAVLHLQQRRVHLCGIGKSLRTIWLTGLEDDSIQLDEVQWPRALDQGCRNLRENVWFATGADDVEHHAQPVDVRLLGSWRFWGRWHIARRTHPGFLSIRRKQLGGESHIRELRTAVHKDDVLRFDVAVREPLVMNKVKRFRQYKADTDT